MDDQCELFGFSSDMEASFSICSQRFALSSSLLSLLGKCLLFNSCYLKEHSASNLNFDIRTFITHRMIFTHFGSQLQVLVPPAFLYSLGLTSYTRTFLSTSLLSIRPRFYFVLWGKGRFTVFLVPHFSS